MICEAKFWNEQYQCEELVSVTIIDTPIDNIYHLFSCSHSHSHSRDFDNLADAMSVFADYVAAWEGHDGHIMQVGE